MATNMTYVEAQEAVDNGDAVTASELQEMYPDKTMNRIEYDMAKENAELELKAKIKEKYEFNEPRMAARQGRKTCRTGPKGVLTDHEEAKLKWRAIDNQDKMKRERKMYMNLDNTQNETSSKLTIIDVKKSVPTKKQIRRETDHKSQEELQDSDSDSDNDDDDEEDDEEALIQYKLQKMKILLENRPLYGDTKEITAWTFDKEVEGAPHNIWVIIHIYQDYLERCARMNYIIAQIAKSYPHIKFLRARSDRIGLDSYPDIGLPTFIVFKNGEQLQNHIAIHTIIGNPFYVKDVEQFLITNNIVKPVVLIEDHKLQNTKNNKKTKLTVSNNSDIQLCSKHHNDDSDSELDLD